MLMGAQSLAFAEQNQRPTEHALHQAALGHQRMTEELQGNLADAPTGHTDMGEAQRDRGELKFQSTERRDRLAAFQASSMVPRP